jgi:hypothetical protein
MSPAAAGPASYQVEVVIPEELRIRDALHIDQHDERLRQCSHRSGPNTVRIAWGVAAGIASIAAGMLGITAWRARPLVVRDLHAGPTSNA